MFGIDDAAIAATAAVVSAGANVANSLKKKPSPPPEQPHYGSSAPGIRRERTGRDIVSSIMMKVAMAPTRPVQPGATSPSVMEQQQPQIPVQQPQPAPAQAMAGMGQPAMPGRPMGMGQQIPMQQPQAFTGGNPLNALMRR